MRNALICTLILLIALASAAAAQTLPTLSAQRVSVVATAQGVTFNGEKPGFMPALGVGYNLTSALTLVADYAQDFAQESGVGRAGFRARIATVDDGVIYLGGGWVHYDNVPGAEARESWEASLHGAWPLLRNRQGTIKASLIGSVTHDPGEALTTARLGMRWHILGGKPAAISNVGPAIP